MLILKKIAVTGNLASGKSEVCGFFRELGAFVVSADAIVHYSLTPETNLGKKVIELLGSEIVANNKIDRKKIAEKVFKERRLLKQLEQIVHPVVKQEIQNYYQQAKASDASLFVAEIPLLFEVEGLANEFDLTITVVSDDNNRKERFLKLNDQSIENFFARNSHQLPQEVKVKAANYVINNNGSLQDLRDQVKVIFSQII